MDVKIAIKENGVRLFRGPLRDSASASFEKLNRALPEGFVPLVQEDEQLGARIILIPKPLWYTGRMVLGYIAILSLILILAPMPHSLWDVANDVSPYL
jgi:hypothetical protein